MVCKLKFILKFLVILLLSVICFFYVYRFYLKQFYPIKFEEYVLASCEKYNVSKELVFAVIRTESGFKVRAKSKAGAIGAMQIMPETFEWLQSNLRVGVKKSSECLNDLKTNIDYGTYFLSILQNKYNDEKVVLCAYNAGIGTVDRWLNDPRYSDDKKTLKEIPFKETKNYVFKVENSKKKYKFLYFND